MSKLFYFNYCFDIFFVSTYSRYTIHTYAKVLGIIRIPIKGYTDDNKTTGI